MKISPFGNVFRIDSPLRTKRSEGEGGNARQQYDPNQNSGKEQEKQPAEQFDPKLIEDAVSAFKTDPTTQASGLSAVVEGAGPGLKIAVKDCNGTTLRQFTGDEFLRLRSGTTKDARPRGKILDQKL